MKLQKKTVTVGKSKVRYLHGGKGKPMLFLHGWPAAPPVYGKSLEILAENFTVYAPYLFDMKCNTIQEISACVKSMVSQLGVSGCAAAGISFGGAVAAAAAMDKETISNLVLIGPAGLPMQASFGKMLVNLIMTSARMLAHGKTKTITHRMLSVATFISQLRQSETRRLFNEIRSSENTHACYMFQAIQVATTIIWCINDDVFPYYNAPILQNLIKNSKMISVKGDHYWAMHEPVQFAEIVANALK